MYADSAIPLESGYVLDRGDIGPALVRFGRPQKINLISTWARSAAFSLSLSLLIVRGAHARAAVNRN